MGDECDWRAGRGLLNNREAGMMRLGSRKKEVSGLLENKGKGVRG